MRSLASIPEEEMSKRKKLIKERQLLEMKTQQDWIDRTVGHPVHYIQCQCSAAHTFGNVTAFIQNWLIHLFPENTFKTIHVNSKIAHVQMRSTPKEILKKSPPMFILRPRIEWNESNVFLKGTPVIERQGDLYHTYGWTNLQDWFKDDRNKVAIKYQGNRHVMYFDIMLVFGTLMQQLNYANYILNAVRIDHPFNLQTCLESYLSPDLLHQLSLMSGIKMYDENCKTARPEFLKYMNANSTHPVTYKLQGSTQTEEFYRYYPVNIDTLITGFSTDEGEKVGHVMDKYSITFNVRCEFYSTGFYYLFSDKIPRHTIFTVDEDAGKIIPVFTDVLTKDDIDLPLGWQLYASPSCRLEDVNDSVDIDSLFNDSIRNCIKFHVDRGMPITNFLRFRVRKQGKEMIYGKDYTIDLEENKINFINQNTYYTYKIIMLLNVGYVNELIKDVYRLK